MVLFFRSMDLRRMLDCILAGSFDVGWVNGLSTVKERMTWLFNNRGENEVLVVVNPIRYAGMGSWCH